MEKHVLWTPWVDPGLEHLRMARISKGINADGMIVGIKDNVPFRAHYKVRGDSAWRLQQVEIYLLDDSSEDIKMHADGRGHWTDDSGAPLPFLDGCVDMDISATPFTNTLAIQRLGLKPGETAALPVVYVAVPEMEIRRGAHAGKRETTEASGRGQGKIGIFIRDTYSFYIFLLKFHIVFEK